MPEKVVEIKNLVKRFGNFQALKDVSFSVYKGDVFGFLGPNGAGKSTTIRSMLSLITPDSGSIRIFGNEISGNRRNILSRTGSIIEKPDFYKYLSAKRNLEIFSRISGKPSAGKEIERMLDFVGLKGREKDKVAGFSHGMKQRLGIAQALLHDPELIILDEPTTGLDPQGIIDIRNLILQLRTEHRKTVLLSSHQLSEIEIIANRMVIINKGVTVAEGEVVQLLNTEELIAELDVDDREKTKGLMEANFPSLQLTLAPGNMIRFAVNRSRIPEINRLLVENGVRVFSIEGKRKLEDYFIKIVNEQHASEKHL